MAAAIVRVGMAAAVVMEVGGGGMRWDVLVVAWSEGGDVERV
jgi:hypothetical protein